MRRASPRRSPGGAAGVQVEGFSDPRDTRAVRAALEAALRGFRARRLGVTAFAVSREESLRLNRSFRGRPVPGDVLSFPLPPGEPGGEVGEIALCPELVARGARRQGVPSRRWLAHLAVHGTLHLLGFDHRTPAETRRMDGLTRAVLAGGAGR